MAPNDSKIEVRINFQSIKEGIFPDSDQQGVNGSLVPSNKEDNPQKHYVSPKSTSNEYVDLVFSTVKSDAEFLSEYEWDGAGTGVSGSPKKRRVSRNGTGKNVVTVKKKSDGTVVDLMNVWVIWSEGSREETLGFLPQANFTTTDVNGNSVSVYKDGAGYGFLFAISPSIIFDTNSDVPDLTQVSSSEYMITAPSEGRHVLTGRTFFLGADRKWDVARHIRVKIFNPGQIPVHMLMHADPPGHLNAGQPAAVTNPENYPSNPLVANDDIATGNSEHNNPYVSYNGHPWLVHGVGEITSHDSPSVYMIHAAGNNGDTFEYRLQFREWARVQLGNNWFRISDYFDWRVHHKFSKQNGKWTGNGSVQALNNDGW